MTETRKDAQMRNLLRLFQLIHTMRMRESRNLWNLLTFALLTTLSKTCFGRNVQSLPVISPIESGSV